MTITAKTLTTLKKITGPSLRELVEKGDYETVRQMTWYSWIGMICMGIVLGVSLSRLGWI
jgi:hypothetical protein